MSTLLLPDGWELTHADPDAFASGKIPSASEWRPANVPGNVQTSPFGMPTAELYRRDNVRTVQWMEARAWIYRRALDVPAPPPEHEVRLRFEGLDYRYRVLIADEIVLDDEGMFHPVLIPLDRWALQRVTVAVLFAPPPVAAEAHRETTKAQFARGWDFAPTLRTVGIWDDVALEILPKLRVEDVHVETRLQNRQRALVTVRAEFSARIAQGVATIELAGVRRALPLFDADGFTALVEVPASRLWWPNGLGAPTLHELTIALEAPGQTVPLFRRRVGLREVGRRPAAGQRPEDIPLQFTVNGLPFFIQGMNWVPPDACPGEICDRHYDGILERFHAGHVNLVRVWGGGLCEKRRFYERCDELGLLVMQEYPVACGMGRTPAFHRQLQREARAIARKLRRHASVFLFTGGNENYHYWDMLDSDDPALQAAARAAEKAVNAGAPFAHREWLCGATARYEEPAHVLLGGVTAELAPGCLYQNTSAMDGEGEVHGIWTWNPRIGDHRYRMFATQHAYWRSADQHLYSEASVACIANAQTIRDVLGDAAADALPSPDDPLWRMHHGFAAAWDVLRDNWLDLPSTEELFGPIISLRELVALNQYLQIEGGRFMIEELRRKQPRATGVIWWGANEPWPGLAGNALIDWYGRPKPTWAAVANAFASTILSLRYEELRPRALRAELWLSCNAPGGFAGQYEVALTDGAGAMRDRFTGSCEARYGESSPLLRLPRTPLARGDWLEARTRLCDRAGTLLHENCYWFGQFRDKVLREALDRAGLERRQ